MKIAVTGATGFIGSHLAEHLVAAGHEVTVLARSPERLAVLRHLPLRVVRGDLGCDDALRELAAGQEVIVHAAGLTRAVGRADFLRVNVDGSVRLLEAALDRAPDLRRFVYLSSLAALGPSRDGRALDEDAPQRPISAYGASKALAEQALARFADRVPMTFIRPPWAYGPRDRETAVYFRLASRGLRLVVSPRKQVSMVHVANLVQGIRRAAESPHPGVRAYFFTDGGTLTIEEITRMMADASGRRTIRVPVPIPAVAAVAAANELAAALTRRPALVGWRILGEAVHRCWLVSDRRARDELGYRPTIGTEGGIAETAAWYRAEGWL